MRSMNKLTAIKTLDLSIRFPELFLFEAGLIHGIQTPQHLHQRSSFAINEQLFKYQGEVPPTELISAIFALADAVEEDGLKRATLSQELFYHNRRHAAEVLSAITLLLQQDLSLANPRAWPKFGLQQCLLLIAAAIGHDFLHTGNTHPLPGALEQMAADRSRDILKMHQVATVDADVVHALIMSTDRREVLRNHAKIKVGNSADPLLCMKILLSEADVLPSLLPTHGVYLSRQLALEWGAHDIEDAKIHDDRIKFLKQVMISSPHAHLLKLDQLLAAQIDANDSVA